MLLMQHKLELLVCSILLRCGRHVIYGVMCTTISLIQAIKCSKVPTHFGSACSSSANVALIDDWQKGKLLYTAVTTDWFDVEGDALDYCFKLLGMPIGSTARPRSSRCGLMLALLTAAKI